MKNVGIIGIGGFAGRYLRAELLEAGYDVWGVDIVSSDPDTIVADMLDPEAVDRIIAEKKPDAVFNLAGQAAPGLSWEKVILTMHINIDIAVNLVEAIRKNNLSTRLILIGSANQYDVRNCPPGPIAEDAPQLAESPYDVSKSAQESLVKVLMRKYDMDIIMTRSFNHIGPGQKPGFVVTDYCQRIVDLERGKTDKIEVRSLDGWRDFADVRDTVHAYRLLLEKGRKGEIYNVGSGQAYYIHDIVSSLIGMSEKAKASTVLPPSMKETTSLPKVYSDNTKLHADTGFTPRYPIEQTLKDVLEDYRNKA
ncbi:MAG: GDP-mannose 4,6-dehydratase [Clostridiales bacterium]|nr:GDP-mannose 4,6-dehydratase [Clostridiales bacterium]